MCLIIEVHSHCSFSVVYQLILNYQVSHRELADMVAWQCHATIWMSSRREKQRKRSNEPSFRNIPFATYAERAMIISKDLSTLVVSAAQMLHMYVHCTCCTSSHYEE